jgi:hypothetical protein
MMSRDTFHFMLFLESVVLFLVFFILAHLGDSGARSDFTCGPLPELEAWDRASMNSTYNFNSAWCVLRMIGVNIPSPNWDTEHLLLPSLHIHP